jgi:hypothetical protein
VEINVKTVTVHVQLVRVKKFAQAAQQDQTFTKISASHVNNPNSLIRIQVLVKYVHSDALNVIKPINVQFALKILC